MRPPNIDFRLVHELNRNGSPRARPVRVPVTVACRVLKMSTSGFYDWRTRGPSTRDLNDACLIEAIRDVHRRARGTYGVRGVHAELMLGRRVRIGHCRVEWLMRIAGLQGGTVRRPAVFEDHITRQFVTNAPDRLWGMAIMQDRTGEAGVYFAAVIDVFSHRYMGWSVADHLQTELVVDAIDMVRLRWKPSGRIAHSDRGSQFASWLSGHRLCETGLVGSIG